MPNVIVRLLNDLFSLVFPHQCLGCGRELFSAHKIICYSCELDLPMTYFHLQQGRKLKNKMGLDPKINEVFSLYFFNEKGHIESLLYELKYNGNQRVGHFFGQKLAEIIAEKKVYFDGIIGVPLHPKRKRKRGFNQMDLIGKSLSRSSGIPYCEDVLVRTKNTAALSKTKGDRTQVVGKAFEINAARKLAAGHYLLIDDIYTTGATLNACSSVLLANAKFRLSIATIGFRN
ncbi:hypothetical protein N9Z01_02850 [Flavobacteriaceae bacterium]|nr:hypothetical protein [Flavobacteriaceae bacterium]